MPSGSAPNGAAPVGDLYKTALGDYMGARYALVRSEIRRVRPARAQEPPPPFAGLITVPDEDPELKSGELIKLLLSVPKLE